MKKFWVNGIVIAGVVILFLWRGLGTNAVLMPLDIIEGGTPPWQPANTADTIHIFIIVKFISYN